MHGCCRIWLLSWQRSTAVKLLHCFVLRLLEAHWHSSCMCICVWGTEQESIERDERDVKNVKREEFQAHKICPSSFILHNPLRYPITISFLYEFHFFSPPFVSSLFLKLPPHVPSPVLPTPFVPVSSFSDTSLKANMCSCLSGTLLLTFQPCLPVDSCSYFNPFVAFSCCA